MLARLTIPDLRQATGSSCGLACVRVILRFWGEPFSRPKLHTDERDGAHPAALQSALRAAGLRVIAGELLPADLADFTRSGRPVISLIQRDGIGHYVVVGGYSRGKVYYHDPIDGPAVERLGAWVARWQDVDVFGSHYHRFGMIAYP